MFHKHWSLLVGCVLIALGGVLSLISAFFYTLIGVSEIMQHFASTANGYWTNRLYASELTGTTAFAFTGLVTLLGAWIRLRAVTPDAFRASTYIIAACILPSLTSVIELLLLTPEDFTHAIPFAISALLLSAGIVLSAQNMALAQALLRNNFRVTVWNRTSVKADPLVRDGAVFVSSAASAVSASPVVIVCVADYKAANGILNTPDVIPALAGRVLVQLSTGSPQEARDNAAWAQERGVDYLDGAILVTPSQIGGADSAILVSGSSTAFEKSEAILKCMAGNLPYLGEEVGSASALDLAFLSHFFGGLLGFYHGARILEFEGMPVTSLGSMIAEVAPAIGQIIKHDAHVIQSARFANPESSLKNSATVVALLLKQAQEARINSEFPRFASALFRKGMAAGYENEDVAALMKVLREDA